AEQPAGEGDGEAIAGFDNAYTIKRVRHPSPLPSRFQPPITCCYCGWRTNGRSFITNIAEQCQLPTRQAERSNEREPDAGGDSCSGAGSLLRERDPRYVDA